MKKHGAWRTKKAEWHRLVIALARAIRRRTAVRLQPADRAAHVDRIIVGLNRRTRRTV